MCYFVHFCQLLCWALLKYPGPPLFFQDFWTNFNIFHQEMILGHISHFLMIFWPGQLFVYIFASCVFGHFELQKTFISINKLSGHIFWLFGNILTLSAVCLHFCFLRFWPFWTGVLLKRKKGRLILRSLRSADAELEQPLGRLRPSKKIRTKT